MGAKLTVDMTLVVTGVKTFSQERLLPYFPAYELLHTLFTPFFGFAGLVLPYHWKGGWYRTAKLPWALRKRKFHRTEQGAETVEKHSELIES